MVIELTTPYPVRRLSQESRIQLAAMGHDKWYVPRGWRIGSSNYYRDTTYRTPWVLGFSIAIGF